MKQYFPVPFVFLLAIATCYSLYQMVAGDSLIAWLGSAIAVIPMFGFFIYVGMGGAARTSRHLPLQLCAAVIGLGITLINDQSGAIGIATFGLVGTLIYSYWYSPLDRSKSNITVGEKIPEFELNAIDGSQVNSHASTGRNRIWLFIRGNWCPLCVAQVQEMADAYKELNELGADVYLISSQTEKASKQLSEKFNAPLNYLVDSNNSVAKHLGIDHIEGVPVGTRGSDYDPNTAMPTVIITNTDNQVIFADQTDNYRVRPEPDVFIKVLKSA